MRGWRTTQKPRNDDMRLTRKRPNFPVLVKTFILFNMYFLFGFWMSHRREQCRMHLECHETDEKRFPSCQLICRRLFVRQTVINNRDSVDVRGIDGAHSNKCTRWDAIMVVDTATITKEDDLCGLHCPPFQSSSSIVMGVNSFIHYRAWKKQSEKETNLS